MQHLKAVGQGKEESSSFFEKKEPKKLLTWGYGR